MEEEEPEFKTPPTPEQIEDAKLHATAWEYAAGSLSDNCQRPEQLRAMVVTHDQLKAAMWMASAVAGGYRRIVNGAKLSD